ncbi:MAG: DUF2089 domain-containing protein [Tepidanaerobacteraceae bacterium]|nr:DUF2089 domain-containing protein [Tepidanaerobacteraceae bacterium]
MNEIIGRCPVCNEKFVVTRLSCPKCGTGMEGEFVMCKFCYLSREQRSFIEIFIKCRGNLKEMEKELGISYPTIRSRLENVIMALGYKAEEVVEESGANRKEILEKLEKGEISPQEALKLLKGR